MQNIDKSFLVALDRQFIPFIKGECKLPSFSVSVHKTDKNIIYGLRPVKTVSDFTFYEYKSGKYWFSFCNSYICVSEDFKDIVVYASDKPDADVSYEASYLLMQAYMYLLVENGGFMIHSAACVSGGEGVLFCGASGAGKSTQANLWKKYAGANVINYDKPCILPEDDGFIVHGSPWSGKEECFLNEYAPVKAIVFIKQAKENKVIRLSSAQAFSNIYLHNIIYPVNSDIEKKYADIIRRISEKVPVYELYCDISVQAVDVLYKELFKKEVKLMKYKTKDCFELKQVADDYIVIPRGSMSIDFSAVVVFNDSGVLLWKLLEKGADVKELEDELIKEYSIDRALAEKDVEKFIAKMNDNGLLDIIG